MCHSGYNYYPQTLVEEVRESHQKLCDKCKKYDYCDEEVCRGYKCFEGDKTE